MKASKMSAGHFSSCGSCVSTGVDAYCVPGRADGGACCVLRHFSCVFCILHVCVWVSSSWDESEEEHASYVKVNLGR